jgi:hypothetical protein
MHIERLEKNVTSHIGSHTPVCVHFSAVRTIRIGNFYDNIFAISHLDRIFQIVRSQQLIFFLGKPFPCEASSFLVNDFANDKISGFG